MGFLRLCLLCVVGGVGVAPAGAATVKALHRFTDTGPKTASNYAFGANPEAELVQASDGNFYGTAHVGGGGACPDPYGGGKIIGCGTVFRVTPKGVMTVVYSFPYDASTSTAPDGAYPTTGLIQGKDGSLYGAATDGGIRGCNGSLGCGTLFRLSLAGKFTLLHQFCSGDSCSGTQEGGRPLGHLVQLANGELCGTGSEGGYFNSGSVFCATIAGAVSTLHFFQQSASTDGNEPEAALVVGPDGASLYGTTTFGGANGGGTVFAYASGAFSIIHDFDGGSTPPPGSSFYPESALIFGADGRLYGTTSSGGTGGVIFSLRTDGSGFASKNVFNPQGTAPIASESTSRLLLAGNGLMYGTTEAGGAGDGAVYSYAPAKGSFKIIADLSTAAGGSPLAALIEGTDTYLYGTTTLYGGSDTHGVDQGTVFRVAPALKP